MRILLRTILMSLMLLTALTMLSGCSKANERVAGEDFHVESLLASADTLSRTGDYSHALDSLLIARKLLDTSPTASPQTRMRLFYMIGSIYSIYGDLSTAIRYYNMAIARRDSLCDTEIMFKTYSNLFEAYATNGETDKARQINEELHTIEIRDTLYGTFAYLFNSAYLHSILGENKSALAGFHKCLSLVCRHDSTSTLRVFPYSEIAQIYSRSGPRDSAYKYLKLYELTAEQNGKSYVKMSAMRDIMTWAAKTGDAPLASEYLDKYFAYTDSMTDIRAFLRSKESIRQYEEDETNSKIEVMSHTLIHNHELILTLTFIIAVVVLVALFAMWKIVITNRTNRTLYLKNQELSEIERHYKELILSSHYVEDAKGDSEGASDAESDGHREEDKSAAAQIEQNELLLQKIIREMEDNAPYLDSNYSLQNLASAVGSNTKYVSTIINKSLGKNFRSFINEYRIREAERRIKDATHYGHLTIQAIAESVGIKSKTTFVEAFKRQTGLNPSVYAKMARESSENAEMRAETSPDS